MKVYATQLAAARQEDHVIAIAWLVHSRWLEEDAGCGLVFHPGLPVSYYSCTRGKPRGLRGLLVPLGWVGEVLLGRNACFVYTLRFLALSTYGWHAPIAAMVWCCLQATSN